MPQAKDLGQSDGTVLWMAFREACSPWNMMSEPDEDDVLTKYDVVGVVMREVEAKPEPP